MPQTRLVSKPSARRTVRAVFVAAPAVAALVLSLLAFNLLQLLSTVLIPASRRTFWAFNRFLADTWWGWSVTVAKRVWGMRYVYTGDELPSDENALIVANHQAMTDIPFLLALAKQHRRLGDLKWFIKDVIKFVPGIGWGTMFLDCVFVKRNWTKDRGIVERVFSRLTRHKTPFWLVLFAEGTRLSSRKLARSRSWAQRNGKPAMEHVLFPRTAGFAASVQGLGDNLQAIYDITIAYEDGVPTMWQYITGHVHVGHVHIRRFPVAQLPNSRDELSTWISGLFRVKDEALEGFYRDGGFMSGPSGRAAS